MNLSITSLKKIGPLLMTLMLADLKWVESLWHCCDVKADTSLKKMENLTGHCQFAQYFYIQQTHINSQLPGPLNYAVGSSSSVQPDLKCKENKRTVFRLNRSPGEALHQPLLSLGGLCHNLATSGGARAHIVSSRNLAAALSEWEPKTPEFQAVVLQHKG